MHAFLPFSRLLPGFACALSLLLAGSATADSSNPNIIVILADDLGYGDPHCYNAQSKIPTPNIDQLATDGIRFTDAHTPSSVCTPTRYSLLTGRYCWRTRLQSGVLDGFSPPLIEPTRQTLAWLLKNNGYATACIGKWHLGMQWTQKDGSPVTADRAENGFRTGLDIDLTAPLTGGPAAAGFDHFFGIAASLDMPPYCFIENDRPLISLAKTFPEDKDPLFMNQAEGVGSVGFKLDQVMSTLKSNAIAHINRHAAKNPDQPLFLYLPLTAPHLPAVPGAAFQGKSNAGTYGDFVVEVDTFVGAILNTLEQYQTADNTLIIFTSDNGSLWHWWEPQASDDLAAYKISPRGQYAKDLGHQGNGRWRGTKADIYEGGHRVPFLVRWPDRISPGTVSHEPVELTDIFATIGVIINASLPAGAAEDSRSILPALVGETPERLLSEAIVHHSLRGMFAIRQGDWKLVLGRGSGGFSSPREITPVPGEPAGQLYNLTEDPQETTNLYAKHPDLVQQLTALLDQYRAQDRTPLER